jgi:hypothetical protein
MIKDYDEGMNALLVFVSRVQLSSTSSGFSNILGWIILRDSDYFHY